MQQGDIFFFCGQSAFIQDLSPTLCYDQTLKGAKPNASRQACSSHHQIVIWICVCQAQQKWKQILRGQCCLNAYLKRYEPEMNPQSRYQLGILQINNCRFQSLAFLCLSSLLSAFWFKEGRGFKEQYNIKNLWNFWEGFVVTNNFWSSVQIKLKSALFQACDHFGTDSILYLCLFWDQFQQLTCWRLRSTCTNLTPSSVHKMCSVFPGGGCKDRNWGTNVKFSISKE